MTVVDASALIEALLRTPLGASCAERLLRPDDPLFAPHLLDVEVTQVLRRYAQRGDLRAARGREALHDLAAFPLTRCSHEPFLERIWELRHSLSAYEAAYIALAEALDAPLVTCDARMARARGHGARVEVLSDQEHTGNE
ncbi:MAG: type II toxin-antitoxin system VapC family toxin [Spirochaetia bacterium]